MTTAVSRLDAAKVSLESVERRNILVTNFRTATRNYQIAKNDAACHSMRARWIMEQVPLIEDSHGTARLLSSGRALVKTAGFPRPSSSKSIGHVRKKSTHRVAQFSANSEPRRRSSRIAPPTPVSSTGASLSSSNAPTDPVLPKVLSQEAAAKGRTASKARGTGA